MDPQIGFLNRQQRHWMTQTHNHLEHTFFNNFFYNLDSQIGFLNREGHRMTQTQIYNHTKHTFLDDFFDDFFDNFIDHFFDHIFDNLGSPIWFQNSKLGQLWLATNWDWNQNEDDYSNRLIGKDQNFNFSSSKKQPLRIVQKIRTCAGPFRFKPFFWVVGNIKTTTMLKHVCFYVVFSHWACPLRCVLWMTQKYTASNV